MLNNKNRDENMMDLGKGWTLLNGTPDVKDDQMDYTANRMFRKFSAKATDKCLVVIEDQKVVVSDEKGKKAHLVFNIPNVKSLELREFSFYGFVRFQGGQQIKGFATVVMLDNGKIFSLVDRKDATGFRAKSLAESLGYKRPAAAGAAANDPWFCGNCGTQNQANMRFCGHCGTPKS
jgi:NADH pyrophosphatase NudC (nudix superfamily)